MDTHKALSPTHEQILAALVTAGHEGVEISDLCRKDIGGARVGARLGELKQSGYPITFRREGNTTRYWLESTHDMQTAEISVCLTREEAQSLTDRLRGLWQGAQDAVEGLKSAMQDAKDQGVHLALGYASWSQYLSTEFKDAGAGLDTQTRKRLVAQLTVMGMSTRAIAPVVGISQSQVIKDVNTKCSPDSASEGHPSPETTGLDGKTYKRIDRSPKAAQDRADKMREMAEAGASSRQIAAAVGMTESGARQRMRDLGIDVPADRVVGKTRRLDSNRIVDQMVMDLEHLIEDVALIDFDDLDAARVQGWAASLETSRKSLAKFIRRLTGERG